MNEEDFPEKMKASSCNSQQSDLPVKRDLVIPFEEPTYIIVRSFSHSKSSRITK